MSRKHPIIAVTGSSGAGTSTVRHAFADIVRRQGLRPVYVQGAGFHRYTAIEARHAIESAKHAGAPISRFGPECNLFDALEGLFRTYGETGRGRLRYYVHDENDALLYSGVPGAFTEWSEVPEGTDLMLYEGMHGGVAARTWGRRRTSRSHMPPERERRLGDHGVDVATHADFLIGVVPGINLEWIQKIHRDCGRVKCDPRDVVDTILRRLPDYIDFIIPQFALSDINIQRMPLVDTSNPFIALDVPTADESFLVIHFRDPRRFDFPALMRKIPGSSMTRLNTMIMPGGKLQHALEVICGPVISAMMDARD
jgi:phosphoribulokinase